MSARDDLIEHLNAAGVHSFWDRYSSAVLLDPGLIMCFRDGSSFRVDIEWVDHGEAELMVEQLDEAVS